MPIAPRAAVMFVLGLVASACPAPTVTPPPPPPPPPPGPATASVQILAINDLHGQLEPLSGAPIPGGAALLAATLADSRLPENSITVAAGDNIGGSPLSSALFHDEPTVEALDNMGVSLSAVGNHEFDEGVPELLRMQNGGCHPDDGCQFRSTYAGAAFHYLAANVVDKATGARLFPPYEIKEIGGAHIAFVGLATKNTALGTVGALVAGIDFGDEADAVNALVPELNAQHVDAIVVLIHEGAENDVTALCGASFGRVFDLAARMDDAVSVIVSGHTHNLYACNTSDGKKLITSASAHGQALTDIRLELDLRAHKVTKATATNRLVDGANITADATVGAIVDDAITLAAPRADAVVGHITGDMNRVPSAAGESQIGDVVTDAMLAATRAAPASAQAALMNNGGLRANLDFAKSGAEPEDGDVTFGEAFAVQPFQNFLVTVTVTGADLLGVLEGFADGGTNKGIQVAGITFAYDKTAPVGQRVSAADVTVDGAPLVLTDSYRVTTNSILSDSIAGYPALAGAATADDAVGDGVDLDALIAYLGTAPPVAPPPLSRMTLIAP